MRNGLLGAGLLLLGLASACGVGLGEPCRCEDDCRRGLVCAVGGRVLARGECLPPDEDRGAECVESSDIPEDPEELEDPPLFFDLGTRRDLDPGAPGPDDTTSTGTSAAETDTGMGTTDTGTTDTGTGTTDTGTGTTDTGTTDTGR